MTFIPCTHKVEFDLPGGTAAPGGKLAVWGVTETVSNSQPPFVNCIYKKKRLYVLHDFACYLKEFVKKDNKQNFT